ncbi:hypothetical protein GW937_00660 [Candidatus Kaiserbacteria bacterium]|nr:hypothetical protein [Candidatus Kaiserbacteria bacterium]NCT01906.1 hypothetical protein [Candidatus Parcubacteria bacterium]
MRKSIFVGVSVLTIWWCSFSIVMAAEYTVRPFLIDHVAEPRETITEMVMLTNDSPYRKYVVYATVNEISVDTEGEIKEFVSPVMTDRTNTVTSWIEVTRGRIEIPPGEKKEVPLILRINPYATPGVYHAFVGFVPAPDRPTAEAIALRGEADGVIVKITVLDKRNDSMKLSGFLIDRFITGDTHKEIEVIINNTGDIPSAPQGEIIFYNSQGVEISSAPFNAEGTTISPGETVTLTSLVPLEKGIGRFKANLALQYGEDQQASLHDTTFFYLVPLHYLLLLFGVIVSIVIAITLLFRKTLLSARSGEYDDDTIALYVRNGHDSNPKDHDIDLKNTNKE